MDSENALIKQRKYWKRRRKTKKKRNEYNLEYK